MKDSEKIEFSSDLELAFGYIMFQIASGRIDLKGVACDLNKYDGKNRLPDDFILGLFTAFIYLNQREIENSEIKESVSNMIDEIISKVDR